MPTRAPGYEVDWNLIRSFVSVVESGSLAAAARALNLSHPTVARHIQQLESQLGVVLFERRPDGLHLNESGLRLSQVADRMRREAVNLELVGETVRSDSSGRVRVTTSEVLADLLPEVLEPLIDSDEERQVELIVGPERLNLLEREADIAVRHLRPEQSELICRRIGRIPMSAWASREYVQRFGAPRLSDLAGHRFVDGLTMRGLAQALERLGSPIQDADVVFRSDSLRCQRRAAEHGWGIVGLPDHMAARARGLVRVLGEPPESTALEIWLAARPGARQQPLFRLVFDTLADGLERRFGSESPLPVEEAQRSAVTASAENR